MYPSYWTEQLKCKMKLPPTEMRKVAHKENFKAFIFGWVKFQISVG